ncbi:hypothetical protein K2Q02_00010, partial [Patescibacteria group bacterium]|nr:hypothetical protein [Patescibacteria group bacterium]
GTPTWFSGVKQGGAHWNKRTIPIKGFETLLKVEDNIRKGTQHLNENLKSCGGNVERAFRQFQSGSCDKRSTLIDATVSKKLAVYNSCKAGN